MKSLLLCLFFACCALAADEPPELVQARNDYELRLAPLRTKLEDAVKTRTLKYVTDLKALESRATSSGQLDAVLAVQTEREAYESGSSTNGFDAKTPNTPQAAKQLRATFDSDVLRIRVGFTPDGRRLAADYVARLEVLERKLTTQRDIPAALAVRNEKESIQKNEMDPLNPANSIAGKWSYSHRGKKEDRTYTFYRNGTWENTIHDQGHWKWTDRAKRKLSWDYKVSGGTRVDDCILSVDGRQLSGHDDSNSAVQLERLP